MPGNVIVRNVIPGTQSMRIGIMVKNLTVNITRNGNRGLISYTYLG